MRWTCFFYLSIASCFVTLENMVAAQPLQHLLPEKGHFDDPRSDFEYYAVLRRLFAVKPHQWAQVVIVPSNGREEVVSIEGPDVASAQLVHSKASRSAWLAYAEIVPSHREPDIREDTRVKLSKIEIPIERHVAQLDGALQARLLRAWVALLRTTTYGPFYDKGDDGTTYHFTAFVAHYGVIAGATWTPLPQSLVGEFVQIATMLGQYADAPVTARKAIQGRIEKVLRAVEWPLGL